MKRIILLTLLIPVLAHAQRYGHTSAGAAGAGSTANVRANTGWTASGTLARDTLYTNYALFGAKTFGVGGTTQAQNARAKFNVLGLAANDTLAVFSNDGGGVVGDSSAMINGAGEWGFGTGPSSGFRLNVNGHVQASNFYAVSTIRIGGATMLSGSNPLKVGEQATTIEITPPSTGFIGLGTNSAGQRQAFATVRTQTPTADTLFMARNDKNSTLDSTMMVFANGGGYFGGNNLYIGGHRIRSNAAGDSLVFYEGSTMIAAILTNGSYADLVAGTPPTLWRNGPPQEYIWLLRIGVLLLLLLVAFKVYDYAKPRIRKHQTLPGEI